MRRLRWWWKLRRLRSKVRDYELALAMTDGRAPAVHSQLALDAIDARSELAHEQVRFERGEAP